MTDTKRIQELAAMLRDQTTHESIGPTLSREAAEFLDELRQIKEAALSPAIEEIERRLAKVMTVLGLSPEYRDIATLLTAYRAQSLEITRANADYRRVAGELDAAREKLALVSANFEALSKRATEERDRLKGELTEAQNDLNDAKEELAQAHTTNAKLHRRAQANESSWMAALKERDSALNALQEEKEDHADAIAAKNHLWREEHADRMELHAWWTLARPVVEAVRHIQGLRQKALSILRVDESEMAWNEINRREDELAALPLPPKENA